MLSRRNCVNLLLILISSTCSKLDGYTIRSETELESVDEDSPLDCDFERDFCGWMPVDKASHAVWERSGRQLIRGNDGLKVFDHTIQSRGGTFVYVHSSPTATNESVRLINMNPLSSGGFGHCLQFYFQLIGSEAGELRVYQVDQMDLPTGRGWRMRWRANSFNGNHWMLASVMLTPRPEPFYIVFEARTSSGIIALDDVNLAENLCDLNIFQLHRSKPTQSIVTSPRRTTASLPETTVEPTPTTRKTSQPNTTLEYKLLDFSDDDEDFASAHSHLLPKQGSYESMTLRPATQSLPTTTTTESALSSFKRGDAIPIDIPERLEESDLSCDFETNWCGWVENQYLTPLAWYRHSGSTPSFYTGPSIDHTRKSPRGHYLFVESSVGSEGDAARISSHSLSRYAYVGGSSDDAVGRCLRFSYHMLGDHMGQLNIYQQEVTGMRRALVVWHKLGNQGPKWHIANVYLSPEIVDGDYKIVIEGRRGPGYLSDIAIDDTLLYRGDCISDEGPGDAPPLTAPTLPPPTYSTPEPTPPEKSPSTTSFSTSTVPTTASVRSFKQTGNNNATRKSPSPFVAHQVDLATDRFHGNGNDDASLATAKTFCNFEASGMCGWANVGGGKFASWRQTTGRASSNVIGSLTTAPATDHTQRSRDGGYALTVTLRKPTFNRRNSQTAEVHRLNFHDDSSNSSKSRDNRARMVPGLSSYGVTAVSSASHTARLSSGLIHTSINPVKCVSFAYQIWGPRAPSGHVSLRLLINSTRNLVWQSTSLYSQPSGWLEARVPLPTPIIEDDYQLVFEMKQRVTAFNTPSQPGGAALDDVMLHLTPTCELGSMNLQNSGKNHSSLVTKLGGVPGESKFRLLSANKDISLLHLCGFERDFCGWYNADKLDVFDWARKKGDQDAIASPRVDHTTGAAIGHYVQAVFTPQKNDSQQGVGIGQLYSRPFRLYGQRRKLCLSFWYYLRGPTTSSLRILLVEFDKRRSIVWRQVGDLGDGWFYGQVSLKLDNKTASFQLIIEAEKAALSQERTIAAVDDIMVQQRAQHCDFVSRAHSSTASAVGLKSHETVTLTRTDIAARDLNCNFDFNLCRWTRDPVTSSAWLHDTRKHVSRLGTPDLHFLYLLGGAWLRSPRHFGPPLHNATSRLAWRKARISSPALPADLTACFSFYYFGNTWPQTNATLLRVHLMTWNSASATQNEKWHELLAIGRTVSDTKRGENDTSEGESNPWELIEVNVTTKNMPGVQRIILEGSQNPETSLITYIAIDSLSIKDGLCSSRPSPSTKPPATKTPALPTSDKRAPATTKVSTLQHFKGKPLDSHNTTRSDSLAHIFQRRFTTPLTLNKRRMLPPTMSRLRQYLRGSKKGSERGSSKNAITEKNNFPVGSEAFFGNVYNKDPDDIFLEEHSPADSLPSVDRYVKLTGNCPGNLLSDEYHCRGCSLVECARRCDIAMNVCAGFSFHTKNPELETGDSFSARFSNTLNDGVPPLTQENPTTQCFLKHTSCLEPADNSVFTFYLKA